MATIIDLSEEQISDDDDVEIIELRNATQNILAQPPPPVEESKKLNQLQCPICFDDISKATVTSCGHVFCLDCIQQSISSSTARGQTNGKLGVGLCPLCRKRVHFKDTTLLRMKLVFNQSIPPLPTPPKPDLGESI